MSKIMDYIDASNTLKEIDADKENYLIIHYSCESFYGEDTSSKKVTSIAIRKLNDAQTELFSIVRSAEELGIPSKDIEVKYNDIEKKMLDSYFNLVENNSNKTWIHWNMRDSFYGFKAIEHRYKVLGGKPIKIADNRKIDLSRLLIKKYGKGFIGHPRLEKIIEKNDISRKDFLTGTEEALAYENREYNKLTRSTAKKVDIFENILKLTLDNNLRNLASKKEIYGTNIKSYWYRINQNIYGRQFINILKFLIGAVAGYYINQFLE